MKERVEDLVGPRAKAMWVMTFHSACVRILRRESKVLGFTSSFSIYDAADSKRLMALVCRDLDLDPKQYPPKSFTAKVSFDVIDVRGSDKPVKDYTWTDVPVVNRDGKWFALVDNTAHAGGIASLWVNTVDSNGVYSAVVPVSWAFTSRSRACCPTGSSTSSPATKYRSTTSSGTPRRVTLPRPNGVPAKSPR